MKVTTIGQNTETQLLKGCLAGDSRAQQALYEKYAGKMFVVCLRYIKDESEAEDTMVHGFAKVFEKLEQFKGEGSLEGWIRRIMVNQSLLYIRKNKAMYLEVDIEKAEHTPDFGTLDNHLEADDLLNMVQRLPTGYRTVFNLYAIEGYSHKEIAERLGISENTSKSQLSRARALLQKYLLDSEKVLNEKKAGHE